MFHNAALRLSALYLAIIMAISLFFSINLYRVSLGEIETGLDRQVQKIERLPHGFVLRNDPAVAALQKEQLDTARHNLLWRLGWINLGILVLGGAGSYILARRTLEPIEQSHEAQSRFASDASHELRTPLAVMQSEIEVALRDKKLSLDDAKKLLGSNLEELSKLTSLSAGLLRLARSQANGIIKTSLDSGAIINEAVDRLKGAAKAKKIEIVVPKQSVVWQGDHASLVEVVSVLLDNAIKYSPVGQRVTIDATKVGLKVTDSGPGVPLADQPHIFERFYRASGQKQSGHGLGLAIAKTIAQAHGGNITLSSTEGNGATFTLELPNP